MRKNLEEAVELTADDEADLAGELVKSKPWRLWFKPHLEALALKHAQACQSRTLTPAQRAEHVEAANELAELAEYPESLVKNQQAKKGR